MKDTLSGNTAVTVHPPNQKSLPLEQRIAPLVFSFVRRENTLLYNLNGSEGTILPQIGRVEEQDYGLINQSFQGLLGKKNMDKFEKNKQFFKV